MAFFLEDDGFASTFCVILWSSCGLSRRYSIIPVSSCSARFGKLLRPGHITTPFCAIASFTRLNHTWKPTLCYSCRIIAKEENAQVTKYLIQIELPHNRTTFLLCRASSYSHPPSKRFLSQPRGCGTQAKWYHPGIILSRTGPRKKKRREQCPGGK